MPRSGKPMSVRMTNLGPLGWVSGHQRLPLPARPSGHGTSHGRPSRKRCSTCGMQLGLRGPAAGLSRQLVRARELALASMSTPMRPRTTPLSSLSRWARARFSAWAGWRARIPQRSMRLASGDVVVLGGRSRRAYHGVDRIYPDSSTLVPGGGRINLTLRRVTAPQKNEAPRMVSSGARQIRSVN